MPQKALCLLANEMFLFCFVSEAYMGRHNVQVTFGGSNIGDLGIFTVSLLTFFTVSMLIVAVRLFGDNIGKYQASYQV